MQLVGAIGFATEANRDWARGHWHLCDRLRRTLRVIALSRHSVPSLTCSFQSLHSAVDTKLQFMV
ncbi:MAG: hypothetical protein KME57_26245 [Scytonema hyalinum WJT4-NPBG1]|nr:hypothetical protein [Scytonema hyalinum WJT4-NPBG1]